MDSIVANVLWNCGVFLAGAFLAKPLWAVLRALRNKLSKNIDNI